MDKKNNTGVENTGDCNSGYYNSGNRNSGDCNSGDCNSGDYNSGYRNSGYHNSGNRNSGDCNSGYYNSGNRNSGDCNSGDCNSGYRNSGDRNSGDYNSGDRNSGWFNTNEPKMRMFNKDTDMTYLEFCEKFNVIYPDLKVCAWIYDKDMTDTEKKEKEGWSEMGGYLKTLSYKEAWAEYWGRATKEEKDFFLNLPNFDAKIFEEITGINICEVSLSGKKVKVELGGKSYTATID
jgi:hypothetical protein